MTEIIGIRFKNKFQERTMIKLFFQFLEKMEIRGYTQVQIPQKT